MAIKNDDDGDLLLLNSEASGEVEAGVRRVWVFEAASFARVDSSQQRVLINMIELFVLIVSSIQDPFSEESPSCES